MYEYWHHYITKKIISINYFIIIIIIIIIINNIIIIIIIIIFIITIKIIIFIIIINIIIISIIFTIIIIVIIIITILINFIIVSLITITNSTTIILMDTGSSKRVPYDLKIYWRRQYHSIHGWWKLPSSSGLTLPMLRLLSSKAQGILKNILTLSCWYSLDSSRQLLSDEYLCARVCHFSGFFASFWIGQISHHQHKG